MDNAGPALAWWATARTRPPALGGGRTRAGEALIEGRMHGKAVLGIV